MDRLARALTRLRDLPANAWDAVREGLRKLRYRLMNAFARLRDLPADAWDAVRERLKLRFHRLPHPLVAFRHRARKTRAASRGGLSALLVRLRRLILARRPRVPRMAIAVGAATVVTASALGFVALGVFGTSSQEVARPTSPWGAETETVRPGPGVAEPSRAWSSPPVVLAYVNRQGAYRFSYPFGWSLTEQGTDAAVASPGGAAIVTVGIIEGGTAERAADLFVARIASVYADVEISRWEPAGEGNVPVMGTATDAAGNRRRFVVTVVDGPDRDFAIGAFTPVGEPSLETKARTILRSFRLSDEAGVGFDG